MQMVKIVIMYSNAPPSPEHVRRLEELGAAVAVADSEELAIRNAADVDVILGHRYLRQTLPHTRQLKWVQSTAAGVDHLVSPEFLRVKPLLTRCPIFADIVAFHAWALAISMVRRIPEAVLAQHRGEWVRSPFDMLPLPQTAMVLGLGAIGSNLAGLLHRQGLAVLGVDKRRTPEVEQVCDELYDTQNWREQLHRVDLFFLALSLSPQNVNLVDEPILRALPRHAVLINISRGGIVDTSALIKVLNDGHLGGAALDVIEPIPASPADPIWATPRLLITPKMAVFHPDRQRKLEIFIESQVKRYLAGETLLHLVDIPAT